jgi:putative Mg2+ transporter-C (MgtC) family protein
MWWWQQSWITIQQEFSDLGNADDITRVVVRLIVAMALGSALFILIPLQAGMKIDDLSRVLQGVTAGIGFLGAGAILKLREQNDIKGLTTAASVWLTAAIGVAAGMGRETTAIVSAVFAFVILSLLQLGDKD